MAGPFIWWAWWAFFVPAAALAWRGCARICLRARALLVARPGGADEGTALLQKADAAAEEAALLNEAEARLLAARNTLRTLRAAAAAGEGGDSPLGVPAFLALAGKAADVLRRAAGSPALHAAFGGALPSARALRALLEAAEDAGRARADALLAALGAAGRGGSARGARAYRAAVLEQALRPPPAAADAAVLRSVAERDVLEPWLARAPAEARGEARALALVAALEHLRLALWARGADLHVKWAVERAPGPMPFSEEEHEVAEGCGEGGLVEAVGARLRQRDVAEGAGGSAPLFNAPLPPNPAKLLVVPVA